MAVTKKSSKSAPFALGRARFAKISAIEGIVLSAPMLKVVDELQEAGPSSAKRRAIIARKYGLKV
jgi:hypothetical protein